MVKVRFPNLAIVYSYSPKYQDKSEQLREFLEKLGVVPNEEYELENFYPNDSPGDVGLFFDGTFFSHSFIFERCPGELEKSLIAEKDKRVLEELGVE